VNIHIGNINTPRPNLEDYTLLGYETMYFGRLVSTFCRPSGSSHMLGPRPVYPRTWCHIPEGVNHIYYHQNLKSHMQKSRSITKGLPSLL